MSDETYRPTHGAVPPDPEATQVRPGIAQVPPPPPGTVPDPYATRIQRPAAPTGDPHATRVQPSTAQTPGAAPAQQPGHVPATGEVLGGFVLRESLGHGGFAHVYRAESSADGVVALKVLTNSQAGSRERFVTEARLLEQLGGRGFPAFVRADLDAATPWFAMELVPGRTLAQVVHEHGPLPRQDLLRVADDVAGALAVLQEEHYLHRDVKPANIIVSDGRCVLIDLGIAKGHGSQTSTHAAGTLAYMAPELFTRKPHPRSDVYSLGLLLIFCATGSLPADLNFSGRDLTPEDVGPVDPAILPLVLAMTRQDPAERPPLHNIARAVVSLAAQQAPEPGLLHAAETTRVERGVVTEVVTAGSLAAGAAAAGAAAAAAAGQAGPPTQAMDPATQVMGSGTQATGPAGAQTEVFSPAQTPTPAGPPPASIRPQPPVQQQPPTQQQPSVPQGYPASAQPPAGQPGHQGYPGQPLTGQQGSGQQGYAPQHGGPGGSPSYPEPRPSRRDERERERGDDAGWRFVSMLLGLIPAVLLGIAVYQVVRLIPGFDAMPDMSQAPLFRALGDFLLVTLNLPWEWSDTMANLAIPLLGLVLAGVLNMVTRAAGRSEARRRRLWPYFLTIGVWIVVLAVQGIVAAVTESVEKAREDIGNSIEQGIQDQQDNLQDQFDETVQEQQDQIEERAKETGEDFLDSIWPF
ncbi:serine/threonine-protein kinase [Myceligenerans pegani]|uniref:non-specific serine/threonine protein kinase n=1 Tax=Myceligenerans pegani TaxID=2776917 RepID=A0ABR9MWE3_9MICO|nr:serine/threonine-protein kinase [Myceligenerans sp. TRM 65318]MBE1875316.1 serine/threonine protein kinase [Myceligenerans sp. TRM 65318]MBE3017587.1 serine/threonine protein kinase [Myceligenerans sp. TRM 65318]